MYDCSYVRFRTLLVSEKGLLVVQKACLWVEIRGPMVETCAGRSKRVLVGQKGSWCVENGCCEVERGRKRVLVS